MRFLCFSLFLLVFQFCLCQQIELEFQLIDEETAKPISDAHVFISDASIGTTSDLQGFCRMSVPTQETQNLIISHISYETLVLHPVRYPLLANGEKIRLKCNGFDLNEIQITAKRSSDWKKNYRRFKRALLGEGTAASKCKILNPEVLRFYENNGELTVSAVDLLHIDNDYLGYDIRFWLRELIVEADGSKYYSGNGQFVDKNDADNKQYLKRREQVYRNSLAHFLCSLLESSNNGSLKDKGYEISFEKYNNGQFIKLFDPEPGDLIEEDLTPGFYQLHFNEFLSVKHKNLKISSSSGQQVSVSGAEQQRFGSDRSVSLGQGGQVAVSRLYKIKPYLIFDTRGNIINKSAVREYDYWADQRLATTLPIDYKGFAQVDPKYSITKPIDTLQIFLDFIGIDPEKRSKAREFLDENWSLTYVAALLDILRLSNNAELKAEIKTLLKAHITEVAPNYFEGLQWLWKRPANYGDYYANLKAHLYQAIDTTFFEYFWGRERQTDIRLDEIVWGGVRQDGIPPLRNPEMISVDEAQYLSDADVIFGLVINGEARAYPKRILAWHEFFTDDINEQSIAGVYCTLCGTVIIYDAVHEGVKHQLGTSGFLYRSNKLMYDQASQSLWSTVLGKPVVGPLAEQNIELSTLPVETTNWGDWNEKHPNTKVLSLETGYSRNYDEGEAYKEYYSNDALMFPVPKQDLRLPNKARVFIPRPENYTEDPLAISVDFLQQKRIHQDQIGDQKIIVLAESNGASRAYVIGDQQFETYKKAKLIHQGGQEWKVTEEALIGPNGQLLSRLPAHEVFWFAWVNVFPETRIVY